MVVLGVSLDGGLEANLVKLVIVLVQLLKLPGIPSRIFFVIISKSDNFYSYLIHYLIVNRSRLMISLKIIIY